MTDNRSTKAELITELERAREIARNAESRANAAERLIPKPASEAAPEAVAIEAAIRALDKLTVRADNYSSSARTDVPAIERVLTLLASKYGVSLIKRLPCERPHEGDFR